MDAKLKDKWVKALRSGRYSQARGVLRKGDAYCCLGVLCQVAHLKIQAHGDGVGSDSHSYWPIWEKIGNKVFGQELAKANDDGETFDQIADRIEATPLPPPVGMDWELSDDTKSRMVEIDRHLRHCR